jgi:hypothetical protein
MKLQFIIALCIAIAMISCETSRITNNRNQSNLIGIITVDCRSDQQTHQTVIQYLKIARVMEWRISQQGAFEIVEARYENLSSNKASQIEDVLMQQSGVSQVMVKWEPGMVSLVPQRTPTQSATVWPGQ